MTEHLNVGDFRRAGTNVEVWTGADWRFVSTIPEGMSYRQACIVLAAPLDATREEIARWIEKATQ